MQTVEALNKMEGINYRILEADEFGNQTLHEVFAEFGANIPDPLISNIQIAEKDGKIIGIAVLQPQYHAEPIWVHKDYRDTMLHKELIETLLNPLRNIRGLRIFIFAPNSKIVKLAARFGFKQKEYTVMERTF